MLTRGPFLFSLQLSRQCTEYYRRYSCISSYNARFRTLDPTTAAHNQYMTCILVLLVLDTIQCLCIGSPGVKPSQDNTIRIATQLPQKDETPIYKSAGFIVGIAVSVILIVFIVGAIIMRRSTPAQVEERSGRRYKMSQIPYQDPAMWSRPSPSRRRVRENALFNFIYS